ncbi:hypothetical protein [Burkholderia ubonensis]|uniref:hypothetical protein n=1 Tax=Burkholderia ubonensis TaxID=101571 RepID=UPI000A53B648|nr:hypothetical protein [Burkholderia ubonensis]
MLPVQAHAASYPIPPVSEQPQNASSTAASANFRERNYSALLNGDSIFSKFGRKTYYAAVGDEGLRKMLSDQYDMLSRESTTLQDFFPADKPTYKDSVLSHQMPFFRKYFSGTLTEADLRNFDRAHHGFSRQLNRTVQISDSQFDDMKHLIDRNAGPIMRFLTTPSSAIEPFRSLVVTDASSAAPKEPSVRPR